MPRTPFVQRFCNLTEAAMGDEVRERWVEMFREASVKMPEATYEWWKFCRLNSALILALLEEGEIRARMAAAPGGDADPQPETASTPQPLAEVEEQ